MKKPMTPKPGKPLARFAKLKQYLQNRDSAPSGLSSVTAEASLNAPDAILDGEDDDLKSKGFKKPKNPFAKN